MDPLDEFGKMEQSNFVSFTLGDYAEAVITARLIARFGS
jgi:hypothetical protein